MTRVYLHIGAPKTGTTYLQAVLFRNRARLRAGGVLYPGEGADAHFRATLDLRGLRFGGYDDPAVRGAWQRLARQVRAFEGERVVVSHELLAGTPEDVIDRALDDIGHEDVHVVLTARDLGRQVPAVWQEMVKNNQTLSYERYLDQVTGARKGRGARIFWRQQDTAEVLARWSQRVPPERVHLITVPPPGSPSALLWERFCVVLGVVPGDYDAAAPRANASLGLADAELVRRVNEALDDRLDWPDYAPLVKGGLAEKVLAARLAGDRARVPDELRGWFDESADNMINAVSQRGYHVVGDLDELRPVHGDAGAVAAPPPDQVVDAAAYALAELLVAQAQRDRSGTGRLVAGASSRLSGRIRRLAHGLLPSRLRRSTNRG
ncbi:MAG: hypothetical protein M3386_05955 [Actinomycetota bacterium]|nr:hypothetical protein [Nocardioidaceae bacterium]MDQ3592429.1 hypothetical protein [Actinomycetota bacterium]